MEESLFWDGLPDYDEFEEVIGHRCYCCGCPLDGSGYSGVLSLVWCGADRCLPASGISFLSDLLDGVRLGDISASDHRLLLDIVDTFGLALSRREIDDWNEKVIHDTH